MHDSSKSCKKKTKSLIPRITGFAPNIVAAGHLENPTQFVINGSGFGETKGSVYFRDANVPVISPILFDKEHLKYFFQKNNPKTLFFEKHTLT